MEKIINNNGITNLDPKTGIVKKNNNMVLVKFIYSICRLKMMKIEIG